MSSAIHFICRKHHGIRLIGKLPDNPIYESSAWVLSDDIVNALVGARIYFHETKSEPSYFGGSIERVERLDEVGAEKRVVLFFHAEKDARGVNWSGKDHSMAWTSGLVTEGNS